LKIKLICFGISRDIIGGFEQDFELLSGSSVEDLRAEIIKKYPDFQKLASLKFAVGETYVEDTFRLLEGAEVVIIPPVSGG
jgi:molybdopterin converting factor small subunit